MTSMQLPGHPKWSPDLVVTSALLAIVLRGFALFIAAKRRHLARKLLATGLSSLAILAAPCNGVSAASLFPDPTRGQDGAAISTTSLLLVLVGAASVIVAIGLAAALSARNSQAKLRAQKSLLDTAIENMPHGLCMFEADGRIMLFNERYSKLIGIEPATLKELSLLDIFKLRKASGGLADDPEDAFKRVVADLHQGRSSSRIIQIQTGRWVRLTEQPMTDGGWVSTLEDITQWQDVQAQIAHMARYDALTGLSNRLLFREQLERALSRISRNDEVAVHCIDLDNFKDINDALGHPVGDKLLKEVALRLGSTIRATDTLARLGGDEFAIVQVGREIQASDASALASRIIDLMDPPYAIEGHQIFIGTSIGISVAPSDSVDPDSLLKNAEIALYRAKEDGRGTFRFFETGMDARAQARQLLAVDMRGALARHEFELYYQPIYALGTGAIVCFEALLRWNHPLRGMIQPAEFIPLAEETGLIVQIGSWVLHRACQDAAHWSREVAVAVNLSPVQFKSRTLVASVMEALSELAFPANRLELEITEFVFLGESETTFEILHRLRDLGIRISMDDFGTGYSSLSYLRCFPFDKIKIDASFVQELASRNDSMAIVRAVTGLGRSLGIATTAEGVETSEQLDLLRSEGCDEVQGYLFSPPRPALEVETMLTTGKFQGFG